MNRRLSGILIIVTVVTSSIGLPESGDPGLRSTIELLEANTIEDFDLSAPALFSLGRDDAPIVMLEFSDYRCSHCSIFHEIFFPKIKEDYIDTGKLFYVALHHPNKNYKISSLAARAAYCAGTQGQFWEMRDLLFANSLYLDESEITKLASSLGLDMTAFGECLQRESFAELIATEKRCGQSLGVKVTPSFILAMKNGDHAIDGKVVKGLLKWSKFKLQIEETLEQAGKNP